MSKPISVGVVGCGYWGPNLVRNLRSLPDCKCRLVCDVNEERIRHLQTLYPDLEGTTDYDRMLNGSGLDAIVIATSVKHHYGMAKASLLAGKHTFVEKPMTATVEQSEELVELARNQGLVLMVGHTFLYSPAVRKVKEIVDRGDIGEIRYISSRRLNLGLFQKDINVAWDLAPHDISIILHIMEELPTAVNCCGTAHITPGIEDVTSLFLTFARQRCAVVHNSWLDPRKVREITIVGSRRMIVYDDVAQLEKVRIFDTRVETPPHYDTFAEFHYAYHYGDVYVPFVKHDEPLKQECQHFIESIRGGTVPMTDGKKGLELVRVLAAATASLQQNGARVSLVRDEVASVLPSVQPPAQRGNGKHRVPVAAAAARR